MVDQVVIDTSGENEGPDLETQAAMMDAEGEQVDQQEEISDERPEWLPEKFTSVEDMARAYSELEQRMGRQDLYENEDDAKQELENIGVDYDALSQEFWENGDLSDDSYDLLEQAGVPRHIVDSYINAQIGAVEQQRGAIMNEVGGPEGYEQLTQWAADNLDDAEIDYFNNVVDSNDFQALQMQVRAIAARRDAMEGIEPTRNLSGSLSGGGASSYESVNQLMQDMQNPAYERDPAFRAQVEQKLARSNIL